MIVSYDQLFLGSWLCNKIGLVATPDLRCLGSMVDGKLLGVVGYDQFNGASIVMHAAGSGYWLTPDMLWAVFDFPFNKCQANMILGFVPSGNAQAIKMNSNIGFRTAMVLEGAHPDGALVMMIMRKEECRYLKRKQRGQKEQSTCSA